MSRVIFIVLDSVGLIAAPDAHEFGDEGASTLGNLFKFRQKLKRPLHTPHLNQLGLDDLFTRHGISADVPQTEKIGAWGTLEEISAGKDTSSGHWEFAGIPQPKAFPLFPNGFPSDLLETWCKANHLPGVLGNKVASGTNILDELGHEHIQSGKPIVYTSSDSVFQVAAHEDIIEVQQLYKICESARDLLTPLNVGRVIARPFVGNTKGDFTRTENRKDYSVEPDYPNLLDALSEDGFMVYGIGKIDDIFCHRGLTKTNHTGRNETSMSATLKALDETTNERGLIFVNLIDFDQKFGHRRDPEGYAKCLENFDSWLPELYKKLQPQDVLIISADHGNDPTFKGSDHTREIVPFFIYKKNASFEKRHLGHFIGFQHMSKWIFEALEVNAKTTNRLSSTSALPRLGIFK
jgi:phosphopentomutase